MLKSDALKRPDRDNDHPPLKMETILEVENLQTTFFTKKGPVRAVNGISYSIPKGKVLGIVGESGCGKSVTAFSILGLVESPGKITQGKILFKGQDLRQLEKPALQRIRGKQIAMIFQEPMTALNPVLSIGFQLTEQILAHEAMSKAEANDRAIEMLDIVGIPSPRQRVKEFPHQFSGGMRQRAMIAMALSCNPDLLIADEPTTALDVTIQAQILDLLMELQASRGMSIQFITHDLGVISEIADEVLVMYAGTVCEKGEASKILSSPQHPYTVGLLKSIPRLGQLLEELPSIPGSVPNLLDLPTGCPFQNRCPKAEDRCRVEVPTLAENTSGHFAACHYPHL